MLSYLAPISLSAREETKYEYFILKHSFLNNFELQIKKDIGVVFDELECKYD